MEPRDRFHVTGYEFLSFAKNMGKSLRSKFGQKFRDTAKKLGTNSLKAASKNTIQKTAEATGEIVGNKIAENITRAASKSTHGDPRKLMAAKMDKLSLQLTGIPKERYILPERQEQIFC